MELKESWDFKVQIVLPEMQQVTVSFGEDGD